MGVLTKTELLNFLRRANCCFADRAYESTKIFANGDFNRGFCEFAKVESLYHYINALRCESGCTSAVAVLCFTQINFANPVNDYTIRFGAYTASSQVGGSFTPSQLVTEFNSYFVDSNPPLPPVTVTYSNGCFIFTAPCGDSSYNGINMSLDLTQTAAVITEAKDDVFEGGEFRVDTCLEDTNFDTLVERINEQCGCCDCTDFDYELTKDVL